ncbi:MAG: right-handed parallel beta-helix repeat-containing protein, partial [Verrucomicrobiota bacterium]
MRHFIVGVFFLGIWGMTFLFSEIPFVPAEFEGVAEHEGEKRPVQVSLVPTFESCGVYVRFEEVDGIAVCTAEYQKKGETSWQKSFPLVTDSSLKIFKGSLVFLAENEDYDIRIIFLDEQGKKRGVIKSSFKTWSSALSFSKILHVKDLLDSSGFLNLNDLRSDPGEWTKIVGDGEILKGTTDQDAAVWVKNCSRLVLENLKIMGGTRYGIHLQNSQDVRVLNCDISGFGRKGVQDISKDGKFYFPDGTYLNYDPGIFIDQSLNVVVERCYIHDPRGTANCWKYSHPAGPEAVFVRSLGGTVIRYNDFIGSDVHRWNDVIEGFENGSPLGGFYRDSDIYGNMLAFANDDCVELDGGQ